MKVIILAGGRGTRISEESILKPKPMVEIGEKPILWHIMKIYSQFGFNEFIILLGYKGHVIKDYFSNYLLHSSDVTFDLKNDKIQIHKDESESWKVTMLDTGIDTMTGSRVKCAQKFVEGERFMLTYGDGVGNINIDELIKFHKNHKKIMTLTSSQVEARFGALSIGENNCVNEFKEKPKGEGSWVNAGYYVCEPEVFDYIEDGNNVIMEQEPLSNLALDGELFTFKHKDFWMPMDTMNDNIRLNEMWNQDKAPWKIWE